MVPGPGSTVYFECDGNRIPPVTYALVSGHLADIPELPGWLARRLRAFQPRVKRGRGESPAEPWSHWQAECELERRARLIAAAVPGTRNPTLNRWSWPLRRAIPSLGRKAVEDALWNACEMNGLAGEEPAKTSGTIRSALG